MTYPVTTLSSPPDPDALLIGYADGRRDGLKEATPPPVRATRGGFRYVITNDDKAPTGKPLFLLLVMSTHRHTNPDGTLSIGNDELMRLTSLARATVVKYLKVAIDSGWLQRISKGGTPGQRRGDTSVYALTIPVRAAIETARPKDLLGKAPDQVQKAPDQVQKKNVVAPDQVQTGYASTMYLNPVRTNQPRSDGRSSTEEKKPTTGTTFARSLSPSAQIRQDDPDGWARALTDAKNTPNVRSVTGLAVQIYRGRQAESADLARLEEAKTRPCPDPKCDHGYVRLKPDDAYGHPCDSEPCRLRREVAR